VYAIAVIYSSSQPEHDPSFFEGPEKKLEIAVVPGYPDLRSFGDDVWFEVVEVCGATVLSKRSNREVDAYLLSESSLFVYADHVTMITCGRTRLVNAVFKIVEKVSIDHIALLLYERKNEHFPLRQQADFYDDAKRLAAVVPGAALQFGAEDRHHICIFHSSRSYEPHVSDTTIEILMHGIPDHIARNFRGLEQGGDHCVAHQLRLDRVFTGFDIDEYVFQPVGYSLNALRNEIYYTIHVTPETLGSYVSFETNMDFREDPWALIHRITGIFAPESFDVFAFSPRGYEFKVTATEYVLLNHARQEVCGYDVAFLEFAKPHCEIRPAKPIPLP